MALTGINGQKLRNGDGGVVGKGEQSEMAVWSELLGDVGMVALLVVRR